MENYYLSEKYSGNTMAWGKARTDLEKIFIDKKFKSINKIKINANRGTSRVRYYFEITKAIREIKGSLKLLRRQNIFIQYPIMKEKYLGRTILKATDKNNIILFIHDILGIRYGDSKVLEDELIMFNACKKIVVHNRLMKEKLISLGVDDSKLVELELFDYLLTEEKHKKFSFAGKKVVGFAGNLDKSLFLEKWLALKRGYKINLYGLNSKKYNLDNAEYSGSYSPEVIPREIKASFGLVWDGEGLFGGEGISGEYIRINNPHKLSMYIAARIPVIVWDESAIAKFVTKNNIGICITNITEIDAAIQNISKEDYETFYNNIDLIYNKIISGFYTKKAIDTVLKQISEE